MKTLFLRLSFCGALVCGFYAQGQPYKWSTLAGSGDIGTANGTNFDSAFFQPYGLAVDRAGNLFVADTQNNLLRQVSPVGGDWVTTTLAGSDPGFVDGTNGAAQFDYPAGIAVDSSGTLYVADYYNHAIRKAVRLGADWVVTTVAGNGSRGSANGTNQYAQFYHPTGIAVDGAGNLYVADNGNNTLRKITPQGTNWVVTTLAGTAGVLGTADGTNAAAKFAGPWGIAVGSGGSLYVSDFVSSRLRRITPVGTNWIVTTIAGSGYGSADGVNTAAQFNYPMGISVDSGGNLYVADYYNDEIRRAQPVGTNWVVSTLGGLAGVTGTNNGTGTNAAFNLPRGVAAASDGSLFVADSGNNIIRQGQAGLLLRIALSGSQIILTCPSPATNFVLQTTSNIRPAGTLWSPVTTGVTLVGNTFVLPNNPATPRAFFRLQQ